MMRQCSRDDTCRVMMPSHAQPARTLCKRGGRAGGRGGGRISGGRGQQKPKGECHYCGKPGHFVRDCRHKAADAAAAERYQQHMSKRPTEHINLALVALSPSLQRPSPLGSWGQKRAPSSSLTQQKWYVDSGATIHVTNTIESFRFGTYEKFSGTEKQTLAYGQGSTSAAKGSGTVDILDKCGKVVLTLYDVWYVPSCTTNLRPPLVGTLIRPLTF